MTQSPTTTADSLLLNVLRALDDEGVELTLFVQGAIITGRAVRRGHFYRKTFLETMESLDDAWDDTVAVCDRLDAEDEYAAGLTGQDRSSLGPDDQLIFDEALRHINLLDAHYVSGALVSPSEPLHIRLRTDAVSGWSPTRIVPGRP